MLICSYTEQETPPNQHTHMFAIIPLWDMSITADRFASVKVKDLDVTVPGCGFSHTMDAVINTLTLNYH